MVAEQSQVHQQLQCRAQNENETAWLVEWSNSGTEMLAGHALVAISVVSFCRKYLQAYKKSAERN